MILFLVHDRKKKDSMAYVTNERQVLEVEEIISNISFFPSFPHQLGESFHSDLKLQNIDNLIPFLSLLSLGYMFVKVLKSNKIIVKNKWPLTRIIFFPW